MGRSIKMSVHWRSIWFAVCALSIGAGVCSADGKGGAVVNCDVQNGVCTQPLNGDMVTLEVLPRPVKAMADLTFRVAYDGHAPKAPPFIELTMLVMDMGENRVQLKPDGRSAYEGRGVIVRCRSGIRTWSAKVTFPGVGSTEFIFDVVY